MIDLIKLLFIEDDEIDQQAFVRFIKKSHLPYDYVIVNSLSKAHQQLQEQSFDIIICDYMLGDGTALEFVQAYPHLPTMVVTGTGDESIAVTLMKAGAKDYLVKELNNEHLRILPKAIQNTLRHCQLEASEREQRLFANTLHHTARILNNTLDLDEVLKLILENIQRIIPHDSSSVMLIEEDIAHIVQCHGWSVEESDTSEKLEFHIPDSPYLHIMHITHQTCIIEDLKVLDSRIDFLRHPDLCSYMGAPISTDNHVIGFLNLGSKTEKYFTHKHAEKLLAFVNQVAIALKNARLYQKAQELAALQERQRLARDLHDSVTQTLFATSFMSNVIIKQWQHDATSIGDELLELRDLTVGALAEMRTLLFELRPNTILETNFIELLHQLLEGVKGRTRLKVKLNAPKDCILPPSAHTTFFRIAQESLSNAIKHARASNLSITLMDMPGHVEMSIRDDGQGFSLSDISSHSFGIKIMQERALEAGLTFEIFSQPDAGTVVTAIWYK